MMFGDDELANFLEDLLTEHQTWRLTRGKYDPKAELSDHCLVEMHASCKQVCNCIHHRDAAQEAAEYLESVRADFAALPCPACGGDKQHPMHEGGDIDQDWWNNATPVRVFHSKFSDEFKHSHPSYRFPQT